MRGIVGILVVLAGTFAFGSQAQAASLRVFTDGCSEPLKAASRVLEVPRGDRATALQIERAGYVLDSTLTRFEELKACAKQVRDQVRASESRSDFNSFNSRVGDILSRVYTDIKTWQTCFANELRLFEITRGGSGDGVLMRCDIQTATDRAIQIGGVIDCNYFDSQVNRLSYQYEDCMQEYSYRPKAEHCADSKGEVEFAIQRAARYNCGGGTSSVPDVIANERDTSRDGDPFGLFAAQKQLGARIEAAVNEQRARELRNSSNQTALNSSSSTRSVPIVPTQSSQTPPPRPSPPKPSICEQFKSASAESTQSVCENGILLIANLNKCIARHDLGYNGGVAKQWRMTNSCSRSVSVHWCESEKCTRMNRSADIASRGQRDSTYSGSMPHLRYVACPTHYSGAIVNFDFSTNECKAYETNMRAVLSK